MEKLLPEAITHIKSVSKRKPTTERLLTYINKSLATNCDKVTVQDTLCILRTKNLIDKNVKLLSENNELVDDKISPTTIPGAPNMPTNDTNKIFDIVLNDIKKDLMRYANSEVENLKALIDNEVAAIKRSIEDLKRTNFVTKNTSLLASLKKEVAYLTKENIIKTEIIKSFIISFNISLANKEKINQTKISTENVHHRDNSSLLAKENNKDTERKNDEKEKPKLKNRL